MNKQFEPSSGARSAALDQVKQSVHSDLQYVSIQVDGKVYGGWYRVLIDGRVELLALANMHCERRYENTTVEQARGMLADFIRVARPTREPNGSAVDNPDIASQAGTEGDRRDCTAGTLGALLYADKAKSRG